MLLIPLLLASSLLLLSSVFSADVSGDEDFTQSLMRTYIDREFYVIAHMANNEAIAKWALRSGANALEMDIQFHPATGEVTDIHHGLPCDCTCYLNMFGGSVCDFDGVCTGHTPHQRVFATILSDPNLANLALIYIDSKILSLPDKTQPLAGEKVVAMLEREVFSKGYRGKVLIGSATLPYLNSVVERASRSAWIRQIYVTYDMFDTTLDAITTMAALPYPNKIFSIGLTACSPNQYYGDTTLGAVNKAKGLIDDVFAWTVDSESSWEEYYIAGARGVITNFIHNMLDWVARKGLVLAKPMLGAPNSHIQPLFIDWKLLRPGGLAWPWEDFQETLVTDIGSCDCGYASGGCYIYTPAPADSACRCYYDGAWACSGQVVGCDQIHSEKCSSPDRGILSCVQGGGDCGGYYSSELSCDCQYSPGGCQVYDPAPAGYACKCSYDEFWMCSGSITKCRDPFSEHCTNPDTSIFSCLQGKGSCGGYTDFTCECSYGAGGCTVTKPAPPGTACQCSYQGAWTCSGTIVTCRHDQADACLQPSTSISSCIEGAGECGAYAEVCDCELVKYDAGTAHPHAGCVVRSPAPANTACMCRYHGWPYYSCSGEVVGCGVYHADSCRHPDTSVDSCLQGGGDCKGYVGDVHVV